MGESQKDYGLTSNHGVASLFPRSQRHQFRLKTLNKHNTLSWVREFRLNEVGFVWDSHRASWNDNFQKLEAFFSIFGHVQVTSNQGGEYSSLATWCKHQRQQYRRYILGLDNTAMNEDRILKLESLGFEWNPRQVATGSTSNP
jgi:hypothetical protein